MPNWLVNRIVWIFKVRTISVQIIIIMSVNILGAQVAVVDKGNPTTCVTFPDCNGYEQNLTECIRGHSFDLLSTTSSNLAGFMCGKKVILSIALYIYSYYEARRLQVVPMVMFDSETNQLKWITQ